METWDTHERQADKTVAKPKQSTVEKAALYCQLIMGGGGSNSAHFGFYRDILGHPVQKDKKR